MAQSQPTSSTPPIEQVRTLVELLETPSLARVYAYVRRDGPVTVADLIEHTDIPQGTAYDYVRKLESIGLLTKTREERPFAFEANDVEFTLSSGDETRTITPELIAAIARRTENADLDVYIDRHGIDGLATAIEYAREYLDGSVNHRIMAREVGLSPLEAGIVLQALEPIVRAHGSE